MLPLLLGAALNIFIAADSIPYGFYADKPSDGYVALACAAHNANCVNASNPGNDALATYQMEVTGTAPNRYANYLESYPKDTFNVVYVDDGGNDVSEIKHHKITLTQALANYEMLVRRVQADEPSAVIIVTPVRDYTYCPSQQAQHHGSLWNDSTKHAIFGQWNLALQNYFAADTSAGLREIAFDQGYYASGPVIPQIYADPQDYILSGICQPHPNTAGHYNLYTVFTGVVHSAAVMLGIES